MSSQTQSMPRDVTDSRETQQLGVAHRVLRAAGAASIVVFLLLLGFGENAADRTFAETAPMLAAGALGMTLLIAGHFVGRKRS